ENQTAHFTQEFAAGIGKLVVLPVEPVFVEINHLQKAARQKLRRENVSNAGEEFVLTAAIDQRLQLHTLLQLRPAQKLFVAVRHGTERLVRTNRLDVGLYQGRIPADGGHLRALL